MNRSQLIELVRNRENSGVVFARDDIAPERLAGEMVGLLNLNGGHVLLGVEKDGAVTGLTRDSETVEEWVMKAARTHVQPATIPYWETIEWIAGASVGIVSFPANAPDKPYKAKRGSVWLTRVRVGSATRDATHEEERLYRQYGRIQYGLKPALGTGLDSFDFRRLRDYFIRVLRGEAPEIGDATGWQSLLQKLNLATAPTGHTSATIDGMLLFGRNPRRFVPQSGVTAVCYAGAEPDWTARADEVLAGPLTPLGETDSSLAEPGLVDQAWDFVRQNTAASTQPEGARRVDRWEYPEQVVREALVNALVHRDYSIAGTDVILAIFSDRLEITSPGRLPNTVTPAGMKSGLRCARNQTLVNVIRDYGYVDARGMGVRSKIIPGMRVHNGTDPDLVEEDQRFTIRLWKDATVISRSGSTTSGS